ncbi:MAG: sugar ABC transporter permease [Firmicutes bacterium]|nr:sugar ABC transporter permease [Bacillota bacterium]
MADTVVQRHFSEQRKEVIPTPNKSRRVRRKLSLDSWLLVAPFIILLFLAGVVPAVYAVVESFTSSTTGGFAGLTNYHTVISNFSFWSSFEDVGILLLVWLPILIVGVVLLALLIDATRNWFGHLMMFIYYIPSALVGIANFMLWMLLIDPTVSPVKFLLHAIGVTTLDGILASQFRVIFVLAFMLFFEGAGSWLLIVYGGLNSIPGEVLEAARIDGCSTWNMIRYVKLPLIAPWIGYMALMNFAYGFQLVLEPQLLSIIGQGLISPQWSPNQLSYTFAYSIGNIGAAAALSIIMLLITLGIAFVIVTRTSILERS